MLIVVLLLLTPNLFGKNLIIDNKSLEDLKKTFDSCVDYYLKNNKNNKKSIISNSTDISYDYTQGTSYISFFYDKKIYYRSLDFVTLMSSGQNLNHLKKFENYKPKNFLEDINKLFLKKELNLDNFKLNNKNYYKKKTYSGWSYQYKYYHKKRIVRPEVSCWIKISDNNQLLDFSRQTIPKFKKNQIVLKENQATEIYLVLLRKAF